MKKLLVALVILIVLGAVVFVIGWVQITVPANGYAVLFSKTSGWESEIVEPGTFQWRWQRLLPTNSKTYIYELTPHRSDVSVRGSLPSGEIYAAFLGEDASFSYSIDLKVAYSVKPSELPRLAQERGVVPEELSAYLDQTEASLSERISALVVDLVERDEVRITQTGGYADVAETLETRLPAAFPQLEIVAIDVIELALPDLGLYAQAREAYNDYVDQRAQALADAAREVARDQAVAARDLDLLEQYGRILDSYPILLDYFSLGREIDLGALNLQELTPPTSSQ